MERTFTVYVLFSEKYGKIYVRYTSNLEERFKFHNELGTKGWTIKFRPWKIMHTEEFGTKKEAMVHEKQLKSSRSRAWIRSQILDG